MWQTPFTEPMEGCFTSLQPWPWKVHEKYQISFPQTFAVAELNNTKLELPMHAATKLTAKKHYELVSPLGNTMSRGDLQIFHKPPLETSMARL